jgi:type II secretory pathway pseudopilin PulG
MALVMAMIVVVLITMLVAGAISFTGTERGAAELQERGDQMSSCIQAARNVFLSQMHTVPAESVTLVTFNETLPYVDRNGVSRPMVVTTGKDFLATSHFSGTPTNVPQADLMSIRDATSLVTDMDLNTDGIDNFAGNSPKTRFFAITAVCRETNPDDPTARTAEREVEFLVRVGL